MHSVKKLPFDLNPWLGSAGFLLRICTSWRYGYVAQSTIDASTPPALIWAGQHAKFFSSF
jgi:hypothetical protein